MSKSSAKKASAAAASSSQANNRLILIALAVVLVIAGGAFVLLNGTGTPAAGVALISPAAYQQQFEVSAAPHLLLDVRTVEEFNSEHIAGAVNIPVESLASRLSEVPKDQPIVVYCRSGNRSATAASILADAGYSSIYDLGGIITWVAQGLPVE